MNCELCGKKTAIYNSEIEGTMMKVCADCAKFGKSKIETNVKISYKEKKKEPREPIYMFVDGYGKIVKNTRERLGLKQDEMAKRLNEKESMLHQIESENFKPNIELARKLERELRIKIVEEIQDEDNSIKFNSGKNEKLTLSDFIRHNKK